MNKTEKRKKLAGLLCIIGPLAAIALMLLGKGGNFGSYALFLLCPLSHLLMMPLTHEAMNKDHCAGPANAETAAPKLPEPEIPAERSE